MERMTALLSIGELATRTGLPVRTIRFYSDSGVVPPADRTEAGYRLYGPDALARLGLVRTLRDLGIDLATIRRVLGVSTDSLSKDWIAATRRAYLPVLEGRTRPRQAGDPILQGDRKSGDMNLAPTVSPDGKLVAFFSRRGLFETLFSTARHSVGALA